jgi:ATP-dependent helicase Lhr and Lhr-like helicase
MPTSNLSPSALIQEAEAWFGTLGWGPFPFQAEAWGAWLAGESGLVNAPTGSGKTYALLLPALLEDKYRHLPDRRGPSLIWITPIRALAREIALSARRAMEALGLDGEVAVRTGDTPVSERNRQRRHPPRVLITTPESLHLLLAQQGQALWTRDLLGVVADEWHELVGSKRGVQVELALSRLRTLRPGLRTWAISATIGNMEEALMILMGNRPDQPAAGRMIRSDQEKPLEIRVILPDAADELPWAGHLGIRLLEKVLPIIGNGRSTLLFTNTRAQCEIWYQQLLEASHDLAGVLAMHHGSIARELRDWVEEALHEGTLKAVVCTSSLDLGVDFRPVDQIIQIGSPKGVARFIQRAGRSGHRPGAPSRIWFLPTHALELLEVSALRQALRRGVVESRIPHIRSFDVLLQYLMTLGVGDGFDARDVLSEVRATYSYASLSGEEWQWLLDFLVTGGSMEAYDEFHRMKRDTKGRYFVDDRRVALRHRLSIGTIVSDVSLSVRLVSGKRLGTVEEWFIAQLRPGDIFWFAGQALELVRVRELEVQVRRSAARTGKVPSWMGGRMPLSSDLSGLLREQIARAGDAATDAEPELCFLRPLLDRQAQDSRLPAADELLIESFHSREGHHILVYPFEGRNVHEGLASLLAWRLTRSAPGSFSMAMNDYGFELLSPVPIDPAHFRDHGLFGDADLAGDIRRALNETEMARRRFRDIAGIGGLIFRGYPGRLKKERHLQSSASLLFDVFAEYDPDNFLYRQAYEELHVFQLEEARLRRALARIRSQRIVFCEPGRFTPFAFPIIVDRLRETMSNESLEARVERMLRESVG